MDFGKPVRGLTTREKRIRSKYVAMFIVAALVAFSLGAIVNKRDAEIKILNSRIDSLSKTKDSLYDENFINSNMVGRYELTVDHFIEEKKLDSAEFYNWMGHETE